MKFILKASDANSVLEQSAGGKATNLARLTERGFAVPHWICVSKEALEIFIEVNHLRSHLSPDSDLKSFSHKVESLFMNAIFPPFLEKQIVQALEAESLLEAFTAVRSSALGEDSSENSFAGQFSSFLYQKGPTSILHSIKQCWISAYSERALSYRVQRGIPLNRIEMGVVIQKMIPANQAGVLFTRNPVHPLDREHLVISSVWGLGDGLVSGELEADTFQVNRNHFGIQSQIAEKTHAIQPASEGGTQKVELPQNLRNAPSLQVEQVKELSRLAIQLERKFGSPQDCEWAYREGKLFILQTRPITNLPPSSFFDPSIKGDQIILWDNSNIIESYSGVTLPLTFSFASFAYREVYTQFCQVVGIPQKIINENEALFRNMLGTIRGRIYYNLFHWYRLVLLLPGASQNKEFMETMMGVKQQLKPEAGKLFDELQSSVISYSFVRRMKMTLTTLLRFLTMDSIIKKFQTHFNQVYEKNRKLDFDAMSLSQLSQTYQDLEHQILRRWHAPIINDYLCMIFFGILKKLTAKWLKDNPRAASLQNDLLCGEGDLESTEPTKALMRIAERIDEGDQKFRTWFTQTPAQEVWECLSQKKAQSHHALSIGTLFNEFLDRYGFRCINELKLEEPDLHDDPSFVIQAVASYVKMKSYSIQALEEKEREIRTQAESQIHAQLKGLKRWMFFWILKQARKAVKNRENLRFDRTKIFGVARHLFRGFGHALTRLSIISNQQDVFYLTVDELLAYVEGRSLQLDLKQIIELRKQEYSRYKSSLPPPDRFTTTGAVGVSSQYSQILLDSDLTPQDPSHANDPDLLLGTPCCPGVIEGVVCVVEKLEDAQNIDGKILVTARTDPGWVPLFPSCSGLLIERGSLLSHSAVVARELGLPTIVGISGGLMQKLKTGQKVRIDAGKGEVRILA